jgi:hypothetical protein
MIFRTSSNSLLLLVIGFFMVTLLNFSCAENQTETDTGYTVQLQDMDKRVIADINLQTAAQEINISDIYRPTFLEFDENGNLYILDYSSMLINRIHLDSGITDTFGEGKGRGPGEFINPTDMYVKDSKIYVADPVQGKIVAYESQGQNFREYRLQASHPQRIAYVHDEKLVYLPQIFPSPSDIFKIFNFADTSYSGEFGQVIHGIHDEAPLSLSHDGFLIESGAREFIYMPMYMGYLAKYRNEEIANVRSTIDGLQSPEIIETAGNYRLDPESIYTAFNGSLSTDYLFVIAYHPSIKQLFLDIYNRKDLSYLRSVQSPVVFRFLASTREYLLATVDTTLYKWNIDDLVRNE